MSRSVRQAARVLLRRRKDAAVEPTNVPGVLVPDGSATALEDVGSAYIDIENGDKRSWAFDKRGYHTS